MHQLCLLEDLDLSSNAITSLDALRPMPCLARLDLSRNSVEDCSPLHPMSGTLRDLSLAHNALHVPDSLAPLSALTRLDVSGNHFRSVDAIGALTLLRELDLSSNALPCPESLVSLTTLALLRSLSIAGNPLCDFEVVDRHVFYLLPQITVQDNQEVDPRDKVHAANTRGLDIPALAAIRERLLPNGELADYGGTSAPLCVTLEAASDCGEWGAGVDAHAAACTVATMRKGITAVCEYLVEACETDLDIVRAAYVWLLE